MIARSPRGTSLGTDRPTAPPTKAPPGVGAGPLAWSVVVCALGGTRTPNLLIRRLLRPVRPGPVDAFAHVGKPRQVRAEPMASSLVGTRWVHRRRGNRVPARSGAGALRRMAMAAAQGPAERDGEQHTGQQHDASDEPRHQK